MAAILVLATSCILDKVSSKRRAKKEREIEYKQNFETFKEENARRVRALSGVTIVEDHRDRGTLQHQGSIGSSDRSGSGSVRSSGSDGGSGYCREDRGGVAVEPPAYDEIVAPRQKANGWWHRRPTFEDEDGMVNERRRRLAR